MVRVEEIVTLALALQRCAVHSGTPLGVLCRAEQELCGCLTPVDESGNHLELKTLDMARKDPVAPTSTERALSPRSRAEEPISVPALSDPPTLEPEEAAQPEELVLVPKRRPPASLALPFCGQMSPAHPL